MYTPVNIYMWTWERVYTLSRGSALPRSRTGKHVRGRVPWKWEWVRAESALAHSRTGVLLCERGEGVGVGEWACNWVCGQWVGIPIHIPLIGSLSEWVYTEVVQCKSTPSKCIPSHYIYIRERENRRRHIWVYTHSSVNPLTQNVYLVTMPDRTGECGEMHLSIQGVGVGKPVCTWVGEYGSVVACLQRCSVLQYLWQELRCKHVRASVGVR